MERSFTGVAQGFQGAITTRKENRAGGVGVTVISAKYYITRSGVAGIDKHEQGHIDLSKQIYNKTIKLAEDAAKKYRQKTPYTEKAKGKCVDELKIIIGWDKQMKAFFDEEMIVQSLNGTYHADPKSEFIVNERRKTWADNAGVEYEASDYVTGNGR